MILFQIFFCQDLIECYLKSSNIPYSNVHSNIITESILVTNPSIKETHCMNTLCDEERERLLFKYRSFKNV